MIDPWLIRLVEREREREKERERGGGREIKREQTTMVIE